MDDHVTDAERVLVRHLLTAWSHDSRATALQAALDQRGWDSLTRADVQAVLALASEQGVARRGRSRSGRSDLAAPARPSAPRPPAAPEPERVAAKVGEILRGMGDDWRASTRAERKLTPLLAQAERYLNKGALDHARALFVAIAGEILVHYESIRDEESEVAGVVGECMEGLGRCLALSQDSEPRAQLLRDLFTVYRWDALDHGGYGMAEAPGEIFLKRTTPQERQTIAAWIRQALPTDSDHRARWSRQTGGRLLLQLLGDTLDEVEREQVLVEAGLDSQRLELLLAQGREADAVQLVRESDPHDLVDLADQLLAAGLGEAARQAVLEHPAVLNPSAYRVRSWLTEQGVELPSHLDDLLHAIWQFSARQNIGSYKELRRVARAAGQWPAALAAAQKVDPLQKKLAPLRARIRADLGDAAGAVAELEALDRSAWKQAAAEVAEILEAPHPTIAAEIYRQLLDAHVAHGTKPARQQAEAVRERLASLRLPAGAR